MVKETNKYTEMMGETGAGITSAEQINMTVRNEFTTKWGASIFDSISRKFLLELSTDIRSS